MSRRLIAVLGAALIVAAACQAQATPTPTAGPTPTPTAAPTPTAPPTPTPEPTEAPIDLFGTKYDPEPGVDGGQVIIGDWQEANQFNPFYLGQVTEANVASLTFPSLVILTADYKYAPDLAADIPTTDNGGVTLGQGGDAMTVTWKLRDGLKWSDGEPLTCDDFKYAWEWVLDPDNVGVITTGYSDITAIDCPSDTEMVQHFENIYEGYILVNLAPLPRHYLSSIPMADQVNGAGFRPDEVAKLPVSGAFKFDTVTPGAELRLAKNPNYTSWKTGKTAHLDAIIFKWYGDPDAMIAGYKGGEVDIATDLQDSDLPKVQDLGDQVSAIAAFTYEMLRPNWSDISAEDAATGTGGCSKNPAVTDRGPGCPAADPAFRQAVAFAIDKNEINNRVLGGLVQVANTNVTPDAWFYSDQPPAVYDPEKAKSILEAAGWVDSDGDGTREKGGVKAKVELCTTTRQSRQDTLALVAAWLKDVGIEAVVNAVSPADIFSDYTENTRETPCALSRSNFDIAEHAFSSGLDPLGNYFSYHSSQFEPDGANDQQVNDPDVDKALDDVKNNVDFKVIRDAMATFQRVYVEKTVEIPLYYRKNVDLHAPQVGNFVGNPTQQGPTWNGVDWYIKG